MRRRIVSYLLVLLSWFAASAQEMPAPGAPALDKATRLEIQGRVNQFVDNAGKLRDAARAGFPQSGDILLTDSYLKMMDNRLRSLDRNLKSLDLRWNNYYPSQQWEISQDEDLMDDVERFEMLRQEASDSLEVRKAMLQSLQDFSEALSYMTRLDTTYNSMGKRAMELSLTPKTSSLLEKHKLKEQLLFATVQEKFDKAKVAGQYNLVSAERMEELEEAYAVLKNKSETIQQMTYKPLIQRIKDYLMGLAAVAVLLMFVNMLRSRIKAAKDARENMKKYKDALHLNGGDEYPTI